jgi:hypothetical protein
VSHTDHGRDFPVLCITILRNRVTSCAIVCYRFTYRIIKASNAPHLVARTSTRGEVAPLCHQSPLSKEKDISQRQAFPSFYAIQRICKALSYNTLCLILQVFCRLTQNTQQADGCPTNACSCKIRCPSLLLFSLQLFAYILAP